MGIRATGHLPAGRPPRPFGRSVTATLKLITVAWFLLLLTWSITLPTYRSADEFDHVSGVVYWQHHHNWPGYESDIGVPAVLKSVNLVQYRDYPPLTVQDAPDRQPSFADLGNLNLSRAASTVAQHPPGYYALVGTLTSVLPSSVPFDVEVQAMRLVSVLMMTPLPLLIAAICRAFTRSRPIVIAGALVPFCVPQLAALGGSVNNDSLLVISASAATLGCIRIARGDLRVRTAVLTGAAISVAILTKAFGLLLFPVLALAVALCWFRTRQRLPAIRSFLLAGAVTVTGLWWWVRNYVVFGAVQPAGHVPAREAGPLSFGEAIGPFTRAVGRYIPERFWAMLSIKNDDRAFSGWFYWSLTAIAVALVLIGVVIARRGALVDRVLVLLPLVLTGLVATYSTWGLLLKTGSARGIQGRYLYVGIAGLCVLLALGLARIIGRRRLCYLPLGVLLAGLLFATASLVRALGYHWHARGAAPWEGLSALTSWSPLGRPLSYAVYLALAGVLALLIVSTTRELVRRQCSAREVARVRSHRTGNGSRATDVPATPGSLPTDPG